ncbi:glycosyltransferase family 2 protein [Pseudonocardiaceae bacterium YIM PH 21723]|nr:glycosyltransferase family 2 protein [Pseudonocardiaceae bacterium YIM PH 21723]
MSRDYALLPRPVKNLLRRLVGRYEIGERWWHLRFARRRAEARRAEELEVAQLRGTLTELPAATVAVIMPTFRRPEQLAVAVRSALAQTVRDIVVLVVDDGGGQTDGLPDDPRLTVLKLSRNHRSPGLARNVAIRLSRSPYVAFLDDDNTWRPDHLEHAIAGLEQGAGLVYTAVQRRRVDGSPVDVLAQDWNRGAHRDTAWVDVNAVAVRRFPGLSFDPWARPGWVHPREDWEMVHRASLTLQVTHLPQTTVDYVVHSGSYFTEWDAAALESSR